jgi:hypothetical protein
MTIKTTIECDGRACGNEIEIDECDTVGTTISYAGWHADPDDGSLHYCADCWEIVEKEITNQER